MQRVADVENVKAVVGIGAIDDADVHEPSVVTHRTENEPLWMILPFINEPIARLRRSELVVVQLLVDHGALEFLPCLWCWEARVEESVSVLRPTEPAELDPLHRVGQLAISCERSHIDRTPIGTALRLSVREIPPVRRGGEEAQRDRSIGGKHVRIDD